MELKKYLQHARLQLDYNALAKPVAHFANKLRAAAVKDSPAGDDETFYSYQAPDLSADGSCSIADTSDPQYYDLTEILGGRSQRSTQRLAALNALVTKTAKTISVDWLGIYQRRTKPDGTEVLVKLAYWGAISRAEFPLNKEFAARSNNSTVGMSGIGRIINNIAKYIDAGGPYYNCDLRVKAEACLPLLTFSPSHIVGIIDAEAWHTDFFSSATLAPLLALCLVAPEFLIYP